MKSFVMKQFKSREMGIFEVADKLLGFPMCEFSQAVEWLTTKFPNERTKMLKPLKEIEKLAPTDT
jgi:hypothetical protein